MLILSVTVIYGFMFGKLEVSQLVQAKTADTYLVPSVLQIPEQPLAMALLDTFRIRKVNYLTFLLIYIYKNYFRYT